MTRYRDDREGDRYMRDMRDDRRYDSRYGRDDDRGLMERVSDWFQGRDDDRGRYGDDRYGDRSGMGQGYGGSSGRGGWGQGYGYGRGDRTMVYGVDPGDMGYGAGASGRSYGQEYGQSQRYGQGYGQSGMSGMDRGMYGSQGASYGGGYGGGQYGSMGQGYGQDSGQGGMQSYRGRGPKGYQRSDERIREEVNDALEDDHSVDASDIEVQVQNGEVTLTGTVSDRQQKRRAEECAERVRGVKDVHNQLRVQQGGMERSGTTMGNQTGSSQSSMGSQSGGIGMGGGSGSSSTVDRTGSTGYTSTGGTAAGSLGSGPSTDNTDTDSNRR
ncbi:BON domain-containing protein [Deinococcus sp. YIM 77859]|uniref:BON domain-containing protein n=1 Tax=Deinococcus sp. YIM 77859 TaxID=1540221 RepID=UPI0005502975|nr:BON domain-containing protein [Deinococcus sp. YIM 77859]